MTDSGGLGLTLLTCNPCDRLVPLGFGVGVGVLLASIPRHIFMYISVFTSKAYLMKMNGFFDWLALEVTVRWPRLVLILLGCNCSFARHRTVRFLGDGIVIWYLARCDGGGKQYTRFLGKGGGGWYGMKDMDLCIWIITYIFLHMASN